MRTLIGVGVALLIAAAIGVWSNGASRSTTEMSVAKATVGPSSLSAVMKAAPAMAIWEIHNQAHLENLPVQEVDDLTFVFTAEHAASK
jgi:hypothetical protein